MSRRNIAITALAFIGSLYFVHSLSSNEIIMSTTDSTASQGIPGLEFSLSQSSKSPPSVLVTLKNKSPTSTYTILKWNTPLDSHAANSGVFKFVDEKTGEEIKTAKVMLRRKMPIEQDQLQEIAPGTEHTSEVSFTQPWMPEAPAKLKVRVEGSFAAVWEKAVGDVQESELEAYTDSPFNDRVFASEDALLVVE